jgi:hypothetical protein
MEGRRYRKHRNLENPKSLSLGHSVNSAATVNSTRRKESMKGQRYPFAKIEISLISLYESYRDRGKKYVLPPPPRDSYMSEVGKSGIDILLS